MARRLRYYEKKRGDRWTGSKTLGSAGEALFFAILLVLGCAGLVAWVVFLVVPEWRVNHAFVKNTCTVLNQRVVEEESEEGTSYRPEIYVRHRVDGKPYSVWTDAIGNAYSSGRADAEATVERFSPGEQYVCWYDPADPYVVVLLRGYNWWPWLVLIIPVSFIVVGGGGFLYSVVHWGKSAERRAAMARGGTQREALRLNGRGRREFPYIPEDSDITSSPGTTLKFRLPIRRSPGWALFGVFLACLLWNGIVSVFVVSAIRGHLRGEFDWSLTLFVIPFVLVGVALIVLLIRQLLLTTGLGPTLVEISDHPLYPGEACRLFVSQWGRLRMKSLEVLLVCEEAATYRQGTDTRAETREVYRREVFRREGFEVHRGLPFEAECGLAVPAVAMHSFKADHNEINWKVVVRGDAVGWPDYERAFPIIVHPANGRPKP